MPDYSKLVRHLDGVLPRLEGEWVLKASGYEDAFVELVGARLDKGTHWDCIWDGTRVELKKGKQHAWLNLIRYAEYLRSDYPEPVLTLFLFYDGKRIQEIYGIDIQKLIVLLGLDSAKAGQVLGLRGVFPHKLNVQSRLTRNDVAKAADFRIPSTG